MIVKANPEWTKTLQPGFCGFIAREDDFVGDGIEYFERYQSQGGVPFCHAFCVTGPDEVIEAHARYGVHRATISQYLGQKDCQCFIRMPIGWTPEIGAKIVAGMAKQIGCKYGYGTIIADLIANTIVGHWINKHTGNVPDSIVSKFLTDAHHRICSQAVACALQTLPYLSVRGCLREPNYTITPKQLGNDPQVFDPIIYKIS